ncbi:hypothetical protein [Nocardia transvalensis]|uniref:hypothetical protein n=1 Tax=Nocardia transvalensis TaxID=37333 RepID=UPI001894A583|nr:hypothetical protein [Nocardia transvalensis]MBF6333586.1 hypothetical protein [Nocardia transvalensis]
MNTVTVTTDSGKTTVQAPYHPNWPSKARALGGEWSGSAWVFDSRDEDRVRQLARAVYGTDGTTDPAGTVTVRIEVLDVRGERGGKPATLWQFGHKIATRFGRDEEPRLGNGVVLVTGGFKRSAGSHNYIELGPLPNTYVEVRDVPRTVALDHELHIVDEADDLDREALRAEQQRLVARLAEIDAILGD